MKKTTRRAHSLTCRNLRVVLSVSLSLRHGCLRLLSFFVLQFLAPEAIQYVTDLFAFDTFFFGNNFSDFFLSFLSFFLVGGGEVRFVLFCCFLEEVRSVLRFASLAAFVVGLSGSFLFWFCFLVVLAICYSLSSLSQRFVLSY